MSPDALLLPIFVILVLGGIVGSFLNVVIYRLPAGLNIAWPGSHCPLCQHPIRWYDNVPVLGWILLRGRCRDCRSPISIRYPLVEAAVASLFGVLFFYEIMQHGANLPLPPAAKLGDPWTLPALLGLWTSHVVLFCTLLAAALIGYDGHRPPRALFAPTLLLALLLSWRWPSLHPVSANAAWASAAWAGPLDWATGFVVGGLLGGMATWLNRLALPASPLSRRAAVCDAVGAAVCIGAGMGWQAACGITLMALAAHQLLRSMLGRHSEVNCIPISAWLGLTALVWVLDWSQLAYWMRLL